MEELAGIPFPAGVEIFVFVATSQVSGAPKATTEYRLVFTVVERLECKIDYTNHLK